VSTPRFTLVVAGRILDQQADGTWSITDKPDSFGFASYDEMQAQTGIKPAAETLTDYGYGAPGEAIGEIITALVEMLPAYRATFPGVTVSEAGPTPVPKWERVIPGFATENIQTGHVLDIDLDTGAVQRMRFVPPTGKP
jgi:hypothetical protein